MNELLTELQGVFHHGYDEVSGQKALIKTTCILVNAEGKQFKGVSVITNGESKRLNRVIAFGRAMALCKGRTLDPHLSYTEDWTEKDGLVLKFLRPLHVTSAGRRVRNVVQLTWKKELKGEIMVREGKVMHAPKGPPTEPEPTTPPPAQKLLGLLKRKQ